MDDRQRISERAAAFDVWLSSLSKAGHPDGDPDTAERALEAFEERRPIRQQPGEQP